MRRALSGLALAVLGSCSAAVPATGLAGSATGLAGWPGVAISSPVGSGAFGNWRTDRFGLPSYRYTIDELRDPRARQPELGGGTDAWSQVGNGHVLADAFNHGYVQVWSQDRRYEWTNRYDPAARHFAGGYGYLRAGRLVVSTLYDDRPAGSRSVRDFGVGYFHRTTGSAGLAIDEYVYAPFGDDPVLLHDVTIRNQTARTRRVSWFEYWDVNPFDQATKTQIGTGAVRWLPSLRALAATQLPTAADRSPLTVFAAALRGRLSGHVGDARTFFGTGRRAVPAAVAAGRLTGALAPAAPSGQAGRAMFGFSAPVVLAPHASITLRYLYGASHASALRGLVRKYSRPVARLAASEQAWRSWLGQVDFGRGRAWLSRELQWDAYMVRSGATYEECRGRHIISQGGYYQYEFGFQGAFRDPLQHMLPMIYADPALAKDVLLYSAQEQPRAGGQIPYAMSELCKPIRGGNSDDLDLWMLLAASEYGLATRDLRVFSQPVAYADRGRGTLWQHLKLAFAHQQSLLGPHGGYLALDNGDWSDFSTTYLQMTESTLVTAQAAYIYPRLALLADVLRDRRFAAALRLAAARALATTRAQLTPGGWYARGYAGTRQIGTGVIFGEPQPWAILAGAPNATQAQTLVAQIRRFLTGVGAPPQVHGPARIGSSQSPATNDPAVTEHSHPAIAGNAAVFPGGSWYAINGWLTWALGTLAPTVPAARTYAFSEFERNTLAAHAATYPAHWDGIVSVDDLCRSFYSLAPASCGAGLTTGYEGQIMHQPAWSLFDAIRLAGITPTASGFEIRPELPFRTFSLALPQIGVGYRGATAHGYVVAAARGRLVIGVQPPAGSRWRVVADGRPVRSTQRGGLVVFSLPVQPGLRASWRVTGS
jgi:Glycosyl hydrolase 36 superfamily, catalytic domain/Glycosyltransferase family 36